MRGLLLLNMRYHLGLSPQVLSWNFLWLLVLRQFLDHIRRQYLLQQIRRKMCQLLKLFERIDVDGLVLDVVGDGAEGEPKEGLVHEGGLQHVHFGEVGKVLEGKQLHHLLEVVVGVARREGVYVDDAETARRPR